MGSHRCVCNPGFEEDSTGKQCVDIDECKVDMNICYGGQCRNTPGSFQVRTFYEYHLVELGKFKIASKFHSYYLIESTIVSF